MRSQPNYYQNPPPLLVGLGVSLDNGAKALEKYQQYCSCLENPTLPYCSAITTIQKKAQRLQGSGFQEDDRFEEDSDPQYFGQGQGYDEDLA